MDNKKKPSLFYWVAVFLIIIFLNVFVYPSVLTDKVEEVSYNTFLNEIRNKNIDKVEVDEEKIYFVLVDDKAETSKKTGFKINASEKRKIYSTVRMNDESLVDRLYDAGATFSQVAPKKINPIFSVLISYVLPIFLFLGIWQFVLRQMAKGGNMMSFGKSNAKIYVKAATGKSFSDVAGQDEAKESLKEIVDILHNRSKYASIGAKTPKGVLLVGPPGTGKTLLAQAVAGEANVPFFSISGSEFVEMFVGMGAAKVRDLFRQANEKAPCIVFIDEIDTIGKKRDGAGISGNDEREQTLNQLLSEMDGFDSSKGVVILAATNRPESLDSALLRPGRFDRRVPVELPDLKGREAILRVHAKKINIKGSVNFSSVAAATSGASGAELANIVNEAALRAVRCGRAFVEDKDFEESVDTILAGRQRKGSVIRREERDAVAVHEVGHAICAAVSEHLPPVHKITIVPRTSGALGFTMQTDDKDRYLMTYEYLFEKVIVLTAGRAAEQLICGRVTTGAANDIEKATSIATHMVCKYGMSKNFGMVSLCEEVNKYLGGEIRYTCSEYTRRVIDEEIVGIVANAYNKALVILNDNKDKLIKISKELIESETLIGEKFYELLNN